MAPLADQDRRPYARRDKAATGALFFGSFLLAAKEMNKSNHMVQKLPWRQDNNIYIFLNRLQMPVSRNNHLTIQ